MNEGGQEDVLKALRVNETLADMDKKYGVTRKSPRSSFATNESNVPAGFQDALRELTERNNAFRAYLDALPREKFVIGPEELRQIRDITSLVSHFLKKYEDARRQIREGDRLSYDKKKMKELIAQLDSLSVWQAKFATECSGGASSDVPLQKYNKDEDSLYYMTLSGATMRIKTVGLANGLQRVVQPFTEKILFIGPNGEISESPREGYVVEEYLTDSFSSAVAGKDVETYQSGLEIYRREGEVAAISHKNEQGLTSFSPAHTGDRVNKIFFVR